MKRIPRIIPPHQGFVWFGRPANGRGTLVASSALATTVAKTVLTVSGCVNEKGEREQTTDRGFLLLYFTIEKLADEREYCGVNKRKLGAL